MSFHSFGVSNFKAFGKSVQRMPIKPITLIFGPNSAGKSSLLHGLLWTLESFSKGNFDVKSSDRVSGNLDLGGFRSVLREHKLENKIRIEFGCGSQTSDPAISICYEVGICSDLDFSAELRRRQDTDPEIIEFRECRKAMGKAFDAFRLLSNQEIDSDAEVEAVLESAETWSRFLDNYHARLYEMDPDHDWEPSREERDVEEMREIYTKGKTAWARLRELGGERVVSKIRAVAEEFEKAKRQELGKLSLISCEIRFRNDPVLRAERPVGADVLLIDRASLVPEAWRALPFDFVRSFVSESSLFGGSISERTPFNGLTCGIHPSCTELPELPAELRERVLPWLNAHWEGLVKEGNRLIYVGPLRALPLRHQLIGHPGEVPRDPLLAPWLRMRDDREVRASVNLALGTLTKSTISFQQAVYGSVHRILDAQDNMPNDLRQGNAFGVEPEPFDWNEVKLMESYVERPEEFLWQDPGPFYEDLKYDEPELAHSMIESHLAKSFPNEVLLDLKVRTASGVDVTLQDVGVGVSQIAPVLVQAYGNRDTMIAIEQPEIHIHPALQAELGDVFIESALGENKNTFLLETHSEHLILRLLRRIRETTRGKLPEGKLPITPADIAVLYVEPGEEGSVVRELRVNDQGRFIDDWPNGFFEERFNEEF